MTFRSLFVQYLERHRVIVMGIYRLLDLLLENNQPIDDQKRIVIYYPPYDYPIDASDMIYIMQHSHFKDN